MENNLIFTFGHLINNDGLREITKIIQTKKISPVCWTDLECLIATKGKWVDPANLPKTLYIKTWESVMSSAPQLIRGQVDLGIPSLYVRNLILDRVQKGECNFRSIRRLVWKKAPGNWLDFEIKWDVDMFLGRIVTSEISIVR